MKIQEIPKLYFDQEQGKVELFVYDFKMSDDVVKQKVNLGLHMFSFLQTGKKQIHFADTTVAVNKSQSLVIKKGNSLWTELLDTEDVYYCKLLFFTDKKLKKFLDKYTTDSKPNTDEIPYFVIKNDAFISSYLNTLSSIKLDFSTFSNNLLDLKFEELMLYLLNKYGSKFELFLHSLISSDISPISSVIKNNLYSNLNLEEIAFLCNMSLSTFKRHFINEYHTSPGKWLQKKRLIKAKEILENGIRKPSEIYFDYGYNNLSNFSIAFKKEFGISPTEINTSKH